MIAPLIVLLFIARLVPATLLLSANYTLVPSPTVSLFTEYARLAAIAYQDNTSITTWSCAYCHDPTISSTTNQTFITTPHNANQGFLALHHANKEIIVTVRGSATVASCLQDAEALQTLISPLRPTMKVHQGFWDVWKDLKRMGFEKTFLDYLAAFPNYEIRFAGHSLGGAVVMLAAVDWLERGLISAEKVKIVTMGQPRTGNKAFANYVNNAGFKLLARVVHYTDIIPHLPPQALDFQHVENEYWINEMNQLVTCDEVPNQREDTNCQNSVLLWSLPQHLNYLGIECAIPVMQPSL
ncbi:hypothetical protein HDU98_007790 [Podochytrium sp. JEL0797]|nr:hypothetical protein HDU98_007790 [Podochytrium sp. JEL0797]